MVVVVGVVVVGGGDGVVVVVVVVVVVDVVVDDDGGGGDGEYFCLCDGGIFPRNPFYTVDNNPHHYTISFVFRVREFPGELGIVFEGWEDPWASHHLGSPKDWQTPQSPPPYPSQTPQTCSSPQEKARKSRN